MKLGPGQATGEEPEGHENSDQVLLLVAGELSAEIGGERFRMKVGSNFKLTSKAALGRSLQPPGEMETKRLPADFGEWIKTPTFEIGFEMTSWPDSLGLLWNSSKDGKGIGPAEISSNSRLLPRIKAAVTFGTSMNGPRCETRV